MAEQVKIIYGSFPLYLLQRSDIDEISTILEKAGVKDIDTARIYPDSEKILGEFRVPSRFTIHTKASGFSAGCLTKDNINKSIEESLSLLGVPNVETYFLHSPDSETPIEETLGAINSLYEQGKFKKFGLSNFATEDVKRIHEYAKSKNYVLPTVYQGNYNAFSRAIEDDLFPLLRELHISFYAYSPIAGGFLAKTVEQVLESKSGRFDKSNHIGQLYLKLYNRPALMKGLEEWNKLAEKTGISRFSLAYRWIAHNSSLKREFGDAVIIGGRSPSQVSGALESISEGPLDPETVKKIDEIWQLVKDEAPLNNYAY
ncbi:hypothetical protein SEUBUCD646_0A00130 [Saccharomyces eubayanus]|uniref:NADP-dependent oxidoreductase domain-containing protein n=1 Tax=Saccharomyces eubayanus TaxID=1080349 RepID=A0ABN8VQE5_SACEU|nr:hypothetical protein SEUBUCD650_0A00120 [Saccharomyces eubayanus]CAI1826042.1 hypothetical protein SEUBUCD646_0A00130 [Saccharomyces eubayanus]